jgi:hypothetical protein
LPFVHTKLVTDPACQDIVRLNTWIILVRILNRTFRDQCRLRRAHCHWQDTDKMWCRGQAFYKQLGCLYRQFRARGRCCHLCVRICIPFFDNYLLLTPFLSTGYHNIRETMKETFSEDVIDRTEEVWGLDTEGESRGCYWPSGQPGVNDSVTTMFLLKTQSNNFQLWFSTGDFWESRFCSKMLVRFLGRLC